LRLYCYHCDYEGKAERGLAPRPSRRKTKICPSCRVSAYQGDWWEEEEVTTNDEADLSCAD
jgi:NMD protein affecting ribosome stability and mRNA decay